MDSSADYRKGNIVMSITATQQKIEANALDRVVQRLRNQFPELAADQIQHAVRGNYDQYASSPIRDFIPILVERSAKNDLKNSGKHRINSRTPTGQRNPRHDQA